MNNRFACGWYVMLWKVMYVTIHGETNHIALGLDLRYEPNKLPMVIIN